MFSLKSMGSEWEGFVPSGVFGWNQVLPARGDRGWTPRGHSVKNRDHIPTQDQMGFSKFPAPGGVKQILRTGSLAFTLAKTGLPKSKFPRMIWLIDITLQDANWKLLKSCVYLPHKRFQALYTHTYTHTHAHTRTHTCAHIHSLTPNCLSAKTLLCLYSAL